MPSYPQNTKLMHPTSHARTFLHVTGPPGEMRLHFRTPGLGRGLFAGLPPP